MLKQILGIILGLLWGLLPLKGFLGLVLFAGISAGIVYVWITAVQVVIWNKKSTLELRHFQGIDEAEYGGAWELTKEGFLTSAAGFLVTWIIVYTGLHIDWDAITVILLLCQVAFGFKILAIFVILQLIGVCDDISVERFTNSKKITPLRRMLSDRGLIYHRSCRSKQRQRIQDVGNFWRSLLSQRWEGWGRLLWQGELKAHL